MQADYTPEGGNVLVTVVGEFRGQIFRQSRLLIPTTEGDGYIPEVWHTISDLSRVIERDMLRLLNAR